MFAWMYPRGNFFAFQIALPSFPTTDPLRIMAGMSVFQSRKVGCYKTLNFIRMDQLICFQNSILLSELTGLVRSVVSRFWNKDMIIHYKDFRRWEKSSSQKFQENMVCPSIHTVLCNEWIYYIPTSCTHDAFNWNIKFLQVFWQQVGKLKR